VIDAHIIQIKVYEMNESKTAIYAALAGNLAIAAVKLIAAVTTGSSAMVSEGIHPTVDTGNQGLLLLGLSRRKKAARQGTSLRARTGTLFLVFRGGNRFFRSWWRSISVRRSQASTRTSCNRRSVLELCCFGQRLCF
jgi:hypothetical protein